MNPDHLSPTAAGKLLRTTGAKFRAMAEAGEAPPPIEETDPPIWDGPTVRAWIRSGCADAATFAREQAAESGEDRQARLQALRAVAAAIKAADGAHLEPLLAACRADAVPEAPAAVGELVRTGAVCLVPTHTAGIVVESVPRMFREAERRRAAS